MKSPPTGRVWSWIDPSNKIPSLVPTSTVDWARYVGQYSPTCMYSNHDISLAMLRPVKNRRCSIDGYWHTPRYSLKFLLWWMCEKVSFSRVLALPLSKVSGNLKIQLIRVRPACTGWFTSGELHRQRAFTQTHLHSVCEGEMESIRCQTMRTWHVN